MSINEYMIGNTVKCTITWKDDNESPYDPTVVMLFIHGPRGSTVRFRYGGPDARITKTGTGQFLFKALPDTPGKWTQRWVATGPDVNQVVESQFIILPSAIPNAPTS